MIENTRIILVRHGESWANRYGIIVSKPEHANKAAGLTPDGQLQVRQATRIAIRDALLEADKAVVYSSELRRCRETARIIAEETGIQKFDIRSELNERNFGDLEYADHNTYQVVYDEDQKNPDHHKFGVESITDIRRRTLRLLEDIEKTHVGKTVVLVTHKDISEIIQTIFENIPPERHRDRSIIPKHLNSEFRLCHNLRRRYS